MLFDFGLALSGVELLVVLISWIYVAICIWVLFFGVLVGCIGIWVFGLCLGGVPLEFCLFCEFWLSWVGLIYMVLFCLLAFGWRD